MGQALSINNPAGTVSNLDSSGNATFSGNITIGTSTSVLIPQFNTITLYSPDGNAINMIDDTGAITTVASGSGTTVLPNLTVGGVSVPGNSYLPSDHSITTWTYDPALTFSGTNSVSGTVYLAKVVIRQTTTVSKVMISISSAAVTPVANQNFLGVYNSAGTLVAQTAAGVLDTLITSSGALTATLSTTPTLTAGTYWVAFLNNAATPTQLGRASSFESTPNANLTNANYRFAINGTARTTLAASITPASNTSSNSITYWAALI